MNAPHTIQNPPTFENISHPRRRAEAVKSWIAREAVKTLTASSWYHVPELGGPLYEIEVRVSDTGEIFATCDRGRGPSLLARAENTEDLEAKIKEKLWITFGVKGPTLVEYVPF